ncbi:unknown [Cercopithecine alphaherpesvirus 9]|uniref:Protein UL24 homolog n=1 Tax=Cercopithecine herpesvirus 9 (strain DHV) TaxID=36348 RepID=Q9E1Y2_CHV9D|nr:nuclear protein UL24 [Cercopithecine alphaherpesvirus 9]AAG27209.1 unknown [Cercopithecine alphaherpesvirus 9]
MSLQKRFRQGQRCHGRFYSVLQSDVDNFKRCNKQVFNPKLPKIFKYISKMNVTEIVNIYVIFEVNLGRRRPDCIILMETKIENNLKLICLIIELKSCRFTSNMNTITKKFQFFEGARQLTDSLSLIQETTPVGHNEILLQPMLIFISQKGLRIVRVTCFAAKHLRGNAVALSVTLIGLAEYRPRIYKRKNGLQKKSKTRNKKTFKHRCTLQPTLNPNPLSNCFQSASIVEEKTYFGGLLACISNMFPV